MCHCVSGDVFNATLRHKSWMDPGTQDKAVQKLGEMFMEVGHPTVWPPATFQTFKEFEINESESDLENFLKFLDST